MAADIVHARTFLFAPGHRADRFEKAAQSGADALVLDLEDSVPSSEKSNARTAIARDWTGLQTYGVPIVLRINAPECADGVQDLDWLERSFQPAAVMVPKAQSVQVLARVHQRLNGVPLLPIIESVAGFAALPQLGAAPGIVRLVIGHIDFIADIGFQGIGAENELAPLRFAVAVATRVNGLAPAVDGVTVEIGDDRKLREDVHRAVRLGFGGKLCIHPRQVDLVHEAMLPSQQELELARKVLAASTAAAGGAVQVDGKMVDLPVVLQARRTLRRAALSDDGSP